MYCVSVPRRIHASMLYKEQRMPNREVGINFGSMSKEGYADDSLLFSWFFGWAFLCRLILWSYLAVPESKPYNACKATKLP